jgi:hypothetical protein
MYVYLKIIAAGIWQIPCALAASSSAAITSIGTGGTREGVMELSRYFTTLHETHVIFR